MKTITLLTLLAACSPFTSKLADDVITGEVKVIDQVAQDITGNPPKASINVVKKKF